MCDALSIGMGMKEPIPTFTYLVKQLADRYPDFAYLHVVEPRVNGNFEREVAEGEASRTVDCVVVCHS